MKKIFRVVSTVITLGIMFLIMSFNVKAVGSTFGELIDTIVSGQMVTKTQTEAFEEKYQTILQEDERWINGFGVLQKIMLKRDLGDVICDKQKQLYLKDNLNLSEKEMQEAVESIISFYEYAKQEGIPFLFVQCPYKNYSFVPELAGYGEDLTEQTEDFFVETFYDVGVPILDLRGELGENLYYITDHHWTCETAFEANAKILENIYQNYKFLVKEEDLEKYNDINNYVIENYPHSFMGSIGIRVGNGYTQKEDFNILIPKFETDFTYQHLVNGEIDKNYSGDFVESFIDEELLLDKNYKNKYFAFLRAGYAEMIIKNKLSSNPRKCLFVSHSYGRPMAQYLSLFFQETRNLDPQEGRYNKSYIEYVKNYKPDLIIVMYNNKISL